MTVGSDAFGQPVVVPDPEATAPGRGAHVHPTAECYQLAVRRKAFGRALRVPTGLPSAPVAEYLGSSEISTNPTSRPTDRNRSSSS